MLAATIDPDGRRVVLTEERWMHIKDRHVELTRYLGEVMRAVREPDDRARGRRPSRESFFVEWRGPGRWLQVVVHYEGDDGRVVTAFPREIR